MFDNFSFVKHDAKSYIGLMSDKQNDERKRIKKFKDS